MHEFEIKDMTCGHCAGNVEKAIKSVDAQAVVSIDVPTRRVVVESTQPAAGFTQAIGDAGYTGTLR